MAKNREAGQATGARRWIALLAWGALGLSVTGCSTSSVASTQTNDPLLNGVVPPGVPLPNNGPKADASTPVPTQASNPGVAALPASLSSSNPATMAGASWQGSLGRPTPIDNNRTSGPPFLPGQSTLGSKTPQVPGFLPPNPNPKVEAIPDVKPANPQVTPSANWQLPANPTIPAGDGVKSAVQTQPANTDALTKQLQDRGVIDQKQDTVPGGIVLTCYVQRPGGLRILTSDPAPDYPTAAQAMLRKLDDTPR